MKNFISSMILIFALTLSTHNALGTDPTPPIPLENYMFTLKSHMDILDAQRDLVRVNFPLLQAISEDMFTVSSNAKWYTLTHAPSIKTLKADVEVLVQETKAKDANAFATANGLKNSCLNCHSNTNPASGHRWDDLPGLSWSKIIDNCNSDIAHEGNPFTCKSMHAMRSMINYFKTSYASAQKNFSTTAEVAKELSRIANDLAVNNFIHGGQINLKNIVKEAQIIEALARQEDASAFTKAKALQVSCTQCHTLR